MKVIDHKCLWCQQVLDGKNYSPDTFTCKTCCATYILNWYNDITLTFFMVEYYYNIYYIHYLRYNKNYILTIYKNLFVTEHKLINLNLNNFLSFPITPLNFQTKLPTYLNLS